jgi:tetratricopeptide (TPR) repeat protein
VPKKACFAILLSLGLWGAPLRADEWGKQVKLAIQAQRAGDLKSAEDLLLKALLSAQIYGDKDPRAAYTLDYLGTLYQQKGDAPEALRVYAQALAGFDKALGPNSPEALSSCGRLAEAAEATEHWAQAESPRRRLLAQASLATQHDPLALAQAQGDLALTLDAQQKYDEAQPLYESALALRRKALGEDAAEVAESLNNLGRLRLMRGDVKQAEALIRQAAAIDEKVLGPADPALADDWRRLASVLRKAGKAKDAVEADDRADAIAAAADLKARGPEPEPHPLPHPGD